jgi:hypothetical protein
MTPHPVHVQLDDDLQRSRLTVFFRLLLAIPHLIWLILWTVAVMVAAPIGWVAALVLGRLPEGLHNFLAAYVRYATHLGAYLGLVANPYPSFTGTPGYPFDVTIPEPRPQRRWKIAFRLLLALPALLLAATLGSGFGGGGGGATQDNEAQWFANSGVGGVAAVCAFLGWFAILAIGRMPNGLRDLGGYGLGYTAQAYAYVLLLTDRYPNSHPEALGPAWSLHEHPVRLELADDLRRSRLTVFFRLLLAIPHYVWFVLWTAIVLLAIIVNWFATLLVGRPPRVFHRFIGAWIRYSIHLYAYLTLIGNPFPGFTGTAGSYPIDLELPEPEQQHRLVTLFRLFLAIPALLVNGALGTLLFLIAIYGWFYSLVTGRMPRGLRNLGAYALRYQGQVDAYFYLLTARYPFSGPVLGGADQPEPLPLLGL